VHTCWPEPQWVAQAPLAQTWFDGHEWPHAPQLLGSIDGLVQLAPHIIWPAGQDVASAVLLSFPIGDVESGAVLESVPALESMPVLESTLPSASLLASLSDDVLLLPLLHALMSANAPTPALTRASCRIHHSLLCQTGFCIVLTLSLPAVGARPTERRRYFCRKCATVQLPPSGREALVDALAIADRLGPTGQRHRLRRVAATP
jgi:hypothetical protein